MSGRGTKRDDQAVELVERLPTADEYIELLRRVGWTPPPVEDCHRALGGSLAAICAVDERNAVVGMGRLSATAGCTASRSMSLSSQMLKGRGSASRGGA
jgi:hypothetical protein